MVRSKSRTQNTGGTGGKSTNPSEVGFAMTLLDLHPSYNQLEPIELPHVALEPVRIRNRKKPSIGAEDNRKLLHCKFPPCLYATCNISHMNRHEMIHSGVKPFKCNQCDFMTNQNAILKTHSIIHTGEVQKERGREDNNKKNSN